jgi:hypothetical protein
MKSLAVGLASSRLAPFAVMTPPLEFDIYQRYLSCRRRFRQFVRQRERPTPDSGGDLRRRIEPLKAILAAEIIGVRDSEKLTVRRAHDAPRVG